MARQTPFREEKTVFTAYFKYREKCIELKQKILPWMPYDSIKEFDISYRPDDSTIVIEWGHSETTNFHNIFCLIKEGKEITEEDLDFYSF